MDKFRRANEMLQTARERDEAEYQRVVDHLDQVEDEIRRRYETLESEKMFVAEAHGDPNASEHDLIEINAGGKIIAAKRGTLCQFKGTRLDALFSGRWDKKLQRDNDGRLFLDVNSEAFQTIVDYLNEMTISPPDNLPQHPATGDENQGMVDHLLEIFMLKKPFDSNIIKDETQCELRDWLKEGDSDGYFRLLYRSSRDGPSARDFHSKCDYRGCTLTVIETHDGLKLGGYSNTPWSSQATFGPGRDRSDKAFLFALQGSTLSKMKLKDPKDGGAVIHSDDLGPTFGGGHDLKVKGSELTLYNDSYDWGDLRGIADGAKHQIKEVEVFQVSKTLFHPPSLDSSQNVDLDAAADLIQEGNSLSNNIQEALGAKLKMLKEAELEIINLENSFKDERTFIGLFACGETKDTVKLNVSGTVMTTKRSTLLVFDDTVLARQFDDAIWTEHSHNHVKEWTPDDVYNWVANIDGIPHDVVRIFEDSEVTGRELLILGIEGLKMIGIKRPATICLLFDEIKKLDAVTLIEHSPYCFGKILDYLRMKKIHLKGLAEAPDLPTVREADRGRFEKVVSYFFPGEIAELILGVPGFGGSSPLAHSLLHFINHGAQNEVTGVHEKDVITHASSQGFSEEDTKNALTLLAIERHIYFTTDDHWHFGR